jgi:hypothetical protein
MLPQSKDYCQRIKSGQRILFDPLAAFYPLGKAVSFIYLWAFLL